VARNVAALVDPPRAAAPTEVTVDLPTEKDWKAVLAAVRTHDWEPLFMLWALIGPRRGEALGLTLSKREREEGHGSSTATSPPGLSTPRRRMQELGSRK